MQPYASSNETKSHSNYFSEKYKKIVFGCFLLQIVKIKVTVICFKPNFTIFFKR